MNRSQRCGVCIGCQARACGHCTYCQDSPQFGGPGVKKQSCIERRCHRVLENRLQRDAPAFKARAGCNICDDCRSPDCQVCLVCLDRRFFGNRYMQGAMCAKKRCNNATNIELPLVFGMDGLADDFSSVGSIDSVQGQQLNGITYQNQNLKRPADDPLTTPSKVVHRIPPFVPLSLMPLPSRTTTPPHTLPVRPYLATVVQMPVQLHVSNNNNRFSKSQINGTPTMTPQTLLTSDDFGMSCQNQVHSQLPSVQNSDPFLPPSYGPGKNVILQPL